MFGFAWGRHSAGSAILAAFIGLLLVTAYIGYDCYKDFVWPTTNAVINAIEVQCVYAKQRVFRLVGPKYHREYLDCDDKDAAALLIADGYRKRGTSSDIWVVYRPEAGPEIRAIVDLWPVDAGFANVGRSLHVRYDPGRPNHVEFASELGHKGTVLGILFLGLLGFGCALLVHLPEMLNRPEA